MIDDDMKAAAEAGRRNTETLGLARNWCAHIRMTKFGGVGVIEQMTGDPIGLHGFECDHAGRGGISTWELSESALDFYDRACSGCDKRKPVGFPNLSILVAKRDKDRAEADRQRLRREEEARVARLARSRERDRLRPGLPAPGAAILDDIEAYDREPTDLNFHRLKAAADLAPEQFDVALTAYVSALAEREPWFRTAALVILTRVGAPPQRLVRLARQTLHADFNAASETLLAHMGALTDDDVSAIAGGAVDFASPDLSEFIGERPEARPDLLLALWKVRPDALRLALERDLSARNRFEVERGARGLRVLQEVDPSAADRSARLLVATYVRAHRLIDDLDRSHERLAPLAKVIANLMSGAPETTDALIQSMMEGAEAAGRARALGLYVETLRRRDLEDDARPPTPAERTAFQRLLWATTKEADDESLTEIQSVFRHHARGLDALAESEIDGLLGAAILLDERLEAMDRDPLPGDSNFLQALERNTRRSILTGLMTSMIEMAARAAAGDQARIDQLVDTLDAMPEGRDRFMGEATSALAGLTRSVAGLNRFLPQLYYGLVGASVYRRASAAATLGMIRGGNRKHIPPLVFEAFTFLLWDQYVVVHKAAVRALDRFSLPQAHRSDAAYAILNLLCAYRGGDDQGFVLTCIERLSRWIEVFGDRADAVRDLLVEAAIELDPSNLRSSMSELSHALGARPRFAVLVARVLPIFADRYGEASRCRPVLAAISDEGMRTHGDALADAATALFTVTPWIAYEVIDRLERAGAHETSAALAKACEDAAPDTVRDRLLRGAGRMMALACAHEDAVAGDDAAAVAEAVRAWRETADRLERYRAEARAQHS